MAVKLHSSGAALLNLQSETIPVGLPKPLHEVLFSNETVPQAWDGLVKVENEGVDELHARNAALCIASGTVSKAVSSVFQHANTPSIRQVEEFILSKHSSPAGAGTVPCAVIFPSLGLADTEVITSTIPAILREKCAALVIEIPSTVCKDTQSTLSHIQQQLLLSDVAHRIEILKTCVMHGDSAAGHRMLGSMKEEMLDGLQADTKHCTTITQFFSQWWPARLQWLKTNIGEISPYEQSFVLVLHDIELIDPAVLEVMVAELANCDTERLSIPPKISIAVAACTSREMFHRHVTRKTICNMELKDVYFMKAMGLTGRLFHELFVEARLPFFLSAKNLSNLLHHIAYANHNLGYCADLLHRLTVCHFTAGTAQQVRLKCLALPYEQLAARCIQQDGTLQHGYGNDSLDYASSPLWFICSRAASWLLDEDFEAVSNLKSFKSWKAKRSLQQLLAQDLRSIEQAKKVLTMTGNLSGADTSGERSLANQEHRISSSDATRNPEASKWNSVVVALSMWPDLNEVRKKDTSTHLFGVPRGCMPFANSDNVYKPEQPVDPVKAIQLSVQSARNGEEGPNDWLTEITFALFVVQKRRIAWGHAAQVLLRCAFGASVMSTVGDDKLRETVKCLYEDTLFPQSASVGTPTVELLVDAKRKIRGIPVSECVSLLEDLLAIMSRTLPQPVVISLPSLFCGAIGELGSLLHRARELCVAAKDDAPDREAKRGHLPTASTFAGTTGRAALKRALQSSTVNDSATAALLDDVGKWLTRFVETQMPSVSQIPMREIFCFDSAPLLEACIGGAPCNDFYSVLSTPKKILECECCSADVQALESCNEDLSIAYRALMEAEPDGTVGKRVPLQEWYQSFRTAFADEFSKTQLRTGIKRRSEARDTVPEPKKARKAGPGTDELQADEHEEKETEIQERFLFAEQQLEYLGLVRQIKSKDRVVERFSADPKTFWLAKPFS